MWMKRFLLKYASISIKKFMNFHSKCIVYTFDEQRRQPFFNHFKNFEKWIKKTQLQPISA